MQSRLEKSCPTIRSAHDYIVKEDMSVVMENDFFRRALTDTEKFLPFYTGDGQSGADFWWKNVIGCF